MLPVSSAPFRSLASLALGAVCALLPACKQKPLESKAAVALAVSGPSASAAPPAQPAASTVKPLDPTEELRGKKAYTPAAAPCVASSLDDEPPALPDLLQRAAQLFEQAHYAQALECAREASRLDPQNLPSHHFRAAALAELGQIEEARTAYARALALDPDDPEVLRSAAELYVRRMGSRDDLELALAYVQRAFIRAHKHQDKLLQKELYLLQAMALDDLGRPQEALAASSRAVELDPKDREARREKGVALFELCRFEQAKADLQKLSTEQADPWAEHYLGLIAERTHDEVLAQKHFARARELDEEDFRPGPPAPAPLFAQLVQEEIERLPAGIRAGLSHTVFSVAELPEVADLVAADPPLSPGILGLYRPPPEGAPADQKPAIVLYRKNLARSVHSLDELRREVRDTLIHEVGHLEGEDDEQLRDRGL